MINDYALQLGWIQSALELKNGKRVLYTLCPDCILRDFETLLRVRALCSGEKFE